MGKRFEKNYEVHYYDVNYKLETSITTIINFFCDIGTKQSEELGVGINEMLSKGLTWVFYKYNIKIHKMPKYGENLKVTTTATGFKKFYASRRYEIFNEDGEKLVDGEGIFLLIDINKRRAVRIPVEQYEIYGVEEDSNFNIDVSRIEKLTEEMHNKHFYTRYSDIDSNRHVNNSRYVEWAIETIPLDMALNAELKELVVVFQKECTYGTKIKASCQIREEDNGEIVALHKIESEEGVELTNLITKWKK